MAVGVGTDFQIYQEYAYSGFVERIAQNFTGFNGASNGALALTTQALRGNYDYSAFFDALPAVARRDPDSVSARTSNNMTQDDWVRVKLHRDREVALTRNQWLRIGSTPQEFSVIYGSDLADQMMLEQLNTGVLACQAAISSQSGAMYDDSGNSSISHTALLNGMAKLGDKAGEIVCWVMHSHVYFTLMTQSLSDKIVNVADVVIRTGTVQTFGLPVVVTDSTNLIVSGSTDHYITLGLTRNAVQVVVSEAPYSASQEVTGLDNLVWRIQTEYAYNLGIKGFTWDTANGSTNPTGTAVGTSTNWDFQMASVKAGPGVRIVSK